MMRIRIVKEHIGCDQGAPTYGEYLEYLDEDVMRWKRVPTMSKFEADQGDAMMREAGLLK